jgi:hypothetical protein
MTFFKKYQILFVYATVYYGFILQHFIPQKLLASHIHPVLTGCEFWLLLVLFQ